MLLFASSLTGTINVDFSWWFDKSHIGSPRVSPVPSPPPFPLSLLSPSLVNFLPTPLFPLLQDSTCSSRSTASPCPWVWRSTALPSSIWSRWGYDYHIHHQILTHTHLAEHSQVMHKSGDEKQAIRDRRVPNYEMIGHTISDSWGILKQRELVCW